MKKEEGQKNIVGDSENDDRDNVISEPLRSAPSPPVAAPVQASPPPPTPGTAPVQALVPRGGGANWVKKAKDVIREDEVFEGPTKNVPKKQDSSPSHAIDIDASGTSSTESKKQDGSPSHALDFDASSTSSTEPKKQDGSPSHAIDFDFDASSTSSPDDDNFKEIGTHPTTSSRPQHARQRPCLYPAITGKVDLQNGARYGGTGARYGYIWKKNDSEGDNSTDLEGDNSTDLEGDNSTDSEADNSRLVLELKSYKKRYVEPKQKMLEVPTMLPRGSHSDYDPKIIAIGPYHSCLCNGNPKLRQMEAIKVQFTLQYRDQSGKSIEKLYEEMKKLLIDAKNYYAKYVTYAFTNKEFAEMMFLDSCFLIQFMDSCVHPENNDIKLTYIETSLIMRDIMLLENQLPFKILTKLMSLSSKFEEGKGEKMIESFVKQIMNDPHIEEAPRRKTCFWFCQTNSESEGSSKKKKEPIHLLELIQTKFVDDEEIIEGASEKPSSHWCSYRTVKELKSVGVHFQPSKSRRFSNITFNSMLLYGRLNLPHITIEDNTQSLLLNLVAFETSVDTQSNFGVSSYVYFMDTLIDHAEDVKELRSKGIILNLLGSDQYVADLFNKMSENVVPDIKVFGKVKNSLNAFYRSDPRLWFTECLHNHFRSPWAIIAFFAAIVALGLTIAQTVFSAIQL